MHSLSCKTENLKRKTYPQNTWHDTIKLLLLEQIHHERRWSRIWQQPDKSMVTPAISFRLPASFREQQEASDICRQCQGSAHVVVSEQANWWRLSKARCVCVRMCVRTGYSMWWNSVTRGKNNRAADCKQWQVLCMVRITRTHTGAHTRLHTCELPSGNDWGNIWVFCLLQQTRSKWVRFRMS